MTHNIFICSKLVSTMLIDRPIPRTGNQTLFIYEASLLSDGTIYFQHISGTSSLGDTAVLAAIDFTARLAQHSELDGGKIYKELREKAQKIFGKEYVALLLKNQQRAIDNNSEKD